MPCPLKFHLPQVPALTRTGLLIYICPVSSVACLALWDASLSAPPPSLISDHRGCEATLRSPRSQRGTSSSVSLLSHGVYLSEGLRLEIGSVGLYLSRSSCVPLPHGLNCPAVAHLREVFSLSPSPSLSFSLFNFCKWLVAKQQDRDCRQKLIWERSHLQGERCFRVPNQMDGALSSPHNLGSDLQFRLN